MRASIMHLYALAADDPRRPQFRHWTNELPLLQRVAHRAKVATKKAAGRVRDFFRMTFLVVGLMAAGVLVITGPDLGDIRLTSTAFASTGDISRPLLATAPLTPSEEYAMSLNMLNDASRDRLEMEVRLLAATMWGEARNTGSEGMRAVGHVMVNRLHEGRWGNTLPKVIFADYQFSVWNMGDPNRDLVLNPERSVNRGRGSDYDTWLLAQGVAREILTGQSIDPTQGALFYHTTAIRPYWASAGISPRDMFQHRFYRDVQGRPAAPRSGIPVGSTAPAPPPAA